MVTILGHPALRSPLEFMNWLSNSYERARVSRHEIIVLALPGGAHDGRVRLNEQHGIASTPDMASICLLAEANMAA